MASVSIADLTISIKDNSKQAAEKVLSLASALEQLRNKQSDTSALKTVASDIATLKSADMGGLVRLRKQLASATTYAERLATAMDKVVKASSVKLSKGATQAITQSQQVADSAQMTTATGQTLTDSVSGAKNVAKGTEEATSRMQKFKAVMGEVGKASKSVLQNILPKGLSNVISQLGRLMRMRILRTVVKAILAGITEGLQNVYQWAKIMGDGFAATMDGMTSSVLYLKNSIGAAFAQILSLIAPHINSLIDMIVTAINYVNMFFAVLAGQSTYTKAKKVAVEYGKAVQGAAGGAAGAVKDLKEELSVLDFDELHQLQEQQEPSRGGGGGGGGGGSAANYADMFEKANIESNWLTKTAGWLKDNFEDVLDYVKAIAAGILAWKITNSLANSLGILKDLSLSQKIGVALAVTGFTLELQGAIGLGKGDTSLANILKTAIGSALGIVGTAMAFKFTPMGWAIGFGVAVTVFVTGFIKGRIERYEEMLSKDELHQSIQKQLDDANMTYEYALEIKARIDKIDWRKDESLVQAQTAQNILDQIKEFQGLKISPEVDLEKLDTLVEAFNSLGLTDIKLAWEDVNGIIRLNIQAVQAALDEYKKYAEEIAKQNAIIALEQQRVLAELDLSIAQKRLGKSETLYDQLLGDFNSTLEGMLYDSEGNKIPTAYLSQDAINASGWTPGQEVPVGLKMSNPELAILMDNINSQLELVNKDKESIGILEEGLKEIDEKLADIYGEVSGINDLVKLQMMISPTPPTIYEKASGETRRPMIGAMAYDLQKQFEQLTGGKGGLNIFADPTKNADGYTGALEGVADATDEATESSNWMFGQLGNGIKVVNDFTDRNKTSAGTLKLVGDESKKTSSTIVSALSGITKGVDMASMGKTMADNFTNAFVNVGKTVTNGIEKDMNGIGSGMQYSTIMSNINTGLTNAQKNVPFSNIGVTIGGNMQSGTVSGYNSTTVMNSYLSGLTDKQKATLFSVVGKAMGADMQGGAYDGFSAYYIINSYLSGLTDKQKNALFSAVGIAMGGDIENGTWNGFSTWYIISEYLKGLTDAESQMSFSSIGTNIAGDIKWGIQNALNGLAIDVTTQVGGTTRSQRANMYVNMTKADGALGLSAGTVFIAGEAGAEAVGTINGKTGVANRDQIASAIAMALQPMLSGGYGTTTTNVMLNMDSRTVARASLKGQRAMNRQYNITAQA